MDRMGRLAVVEGRRRRRTCSRCTEACRVDDGPTAACTDSSTMARSPSSSASSVASVCFCAAESSAFASDSGWYQSAGGALRVGVGASDGGLEAGGSEAGGGGLSCCSSLTMRTGVIVGMVLLFVRLLRLPPEWQRQAQAPGKGWRAAPGKGSPPRRLQANLVRPASRRGGRHVIGSSIVSPGSNALTTPAWRGGEPALRFPGFV